MPALILGVCSRKRPWVPSLSHNDVSCLCETTAVDDVLRAPQGAASEISQAQKIIDQALNMLPEIEQKLAAQKEALSQQVAALMQTKQAKVSKRP